MPPRIPSAWRPCLGSLCFRPASSTLKGPLPTTSKANVSSRARRKKERSMDIYALAQAKQRKAANLARQEVLREERKAQLGDPVRGNTTPFLESFDNVGGSAVVFDAPATSDGGIEINAANDALLNHFLTPKELEQSIQNSRALAEPVPNKIRDLADPVIEAEAKKKFDEGHARATVALSRIVSLANASQEEKTRANIRRCIETFGRHRTDNTLRPRPAVNPILLEGKPPLQEKTPRAGPDTGSSEVQIAILTAKIRVLADKLEEPRGKNDKANKRNLRLMVHRRQKLLRYMRSKERGGERWQHLIEKLGLTEGTWRGEISL